MASIADTRGQNEICLVLDSVGVVGPILLRFCCICCVLATFYATVLPQILRIFSTNFTLRNALATHSLYVYIRSLRAHIR